MPRRNLGMIPPKMVAMARSKLDQDEAMIRDFLGKDPAVPFAMIKILSSKPSQLLAELAASPRDVTALVAVLARITVVKYALGDDVEEIL